MNTFKFNQYLVAADLGTNRLHTYRFDPAGPYLPAANIVGQTPLHAGAGPRHVAFSASGTSCFAVNELDNTISAFHFQPSDGAMTHAQTLPTVPPDWVASGPSLPFDFYSVRVTQSILFWSQLVL